MAVYSPEFLAAARHGYENTDQPMRELARELGIGITTLSTLAEKHGWSKRSQRQRGLPPALQVLEEARALAQSAHSRESGNPALAEQLQPTKELGPRFRGDERGSAPPTPDPSAPLVSLAEGGEQRALAATPEALLARMEQLLAQHIADAEAARAGGAPSPQATRTLSILTQTLRTLAALRTGEPLPKTAEDNDHDYDDMPADINEFRRELARRIDAFVASRGHEFESQDDPDAA